LHYTIQKFNQIEFFKVIARIGRSKDGNKAQNPKQPPYIHDSTKAWMVVWAVALFTKKSVLKLLFVSKPQFILLVITFQKLGIEKLR